jgi:putative ABC transport system permease protein
MTPWTADVRSVWRTLTSTRPSSAAIAMGFVIALAVVGAIFALLQAVLLRPLPFADPDRLVWVWATRVDRDRAFFSIADYLDYESDLSDRAELAAFGNWGVNLQGEGEPLRLAGLRATGNMMSMLGITPVIGRSLERADEQPDRPAVVVLSHGIWMRRFGADPGIIGRRLVLSDEPHEVVGVMPPSFVVANADTNVVGVLKLRTDSRRTLRDLNFLRVVGRLTSGTTEFQLAAAAAATAARLKTLHPGTHAKKTAPRVLSLHEETFGAHRLILTLLLLAAGLSLLLLTANVAQLLTARAIRRASEFSVRAALGASPTSIVRLVLAEPLVLALAGAAAGAALAGPLLGALVSLVPEMPRAADARVESQTLVLLLSAGLVAGILAGIGPALRARHAITHRGDAHQVTRSAASRFLLALQAATSVALLSAALAASGTLSQLLASTAGAESERVLTTRISLPAKYGTDERLTTLVDSILRNIRRSGEVESAAVANVLPLSALNVRSDFVIEGRPAATASEVPGAQHRWVSPQYFETLGIPIVTGRAFTDFDAAAGRPVAIVDATLARQFWTTDPVGSRIRLVGLLDIVWEVVGVAGDVKHQSLDEPPTGTFYMPIAQAGSAAFTPFLLNGLSVALRSRASADHLERLLREAVWHEDRQIPLAPARTMRTIVDRTLTPRALAARLLTVLAVGSAILGAVGIAALTALLVAQRKREFAVRRAIGASAGHVWRDVVIMMVGSTGKGVVAGVVAALFLLRVFESALIGSTDMPYGLVLTAAVLVLMGAALGAALPARRAATVDPALVLRGE